jgi:hypothetical protein
MFFSFARFLPSGLSICTTNHASEITIVDLTFVNSPKGSICTGNSGNCAEPGSILPGDAQASWPGMAKSAKTAV